MRHAHPGDLGLKTRLPAFLLGFLAASFQIFLLREFTAEFYGNELVYGLFLGSWLLGGGLGSLARPGTGRTPGPGRIAALYGAAILLFFAALVLLRFSHGLMGLLPAELTGLGPALGFALLTSLLLSFPLGHAFVLNAGHLGGDVPLVYALESAGAAAAGLVVHFALIPRLSNWEGAAIVAAAAAAAVLTTMKPGPSRWVLAAALVLSPGVFLCDFPSQKAAMKPLRLVGAEDSPYGKLQVVMTGEQATLFNNGLAVFSYPDTGAAEEAVHFALLQRPSPGRVLLIGGGASGGAAEALKYPGLRVDCVELDPAVIGLVLEHIPAAGAADSFPPALVGHPNDPRVRIFHRDGRAWLAGAFLDRYDAILLDLPPPTTAQVNRYYTREFFALVRSRLSPGGVFGFVVPSGENYVSDVLAQFLSSLAVTLRAVFPEVLAIPGANCVFLASDAPLTADPARLSGSIARLGLKTRFVSPEMLPARLDPRRVDHLAARISASPGKINRDLVPVSYYFQSVLWAAQFRGLESELLRAAGGIPRGWLLDAPLGALGLLLALLALSRRRSAARSLVPVAVMGFTSIVVELAVFIVFQANFGYVYGKIPLLLALFMGGLVAGSLLARRRLHPGRAALPVVQAGLVAALAAAHFSFTGRGGEFVPFALLFVFGGLSGHLFVTSTRLLRRESPHQGLAYGVDLLASFAGALLVSAVVIPLWGVPAVLLRLAVLNILSLVFLLATASKA
jgi:spermidine synthase